QSLDFRIVHDRLVQLLLHLLQAEFIQLRLEALVECHPFREFPRLHVLLSRAERDVRRNPVPRQCERDVQVPRPLTQGSLIPIEVELLLPESLCSRLQLEFKLRVLCGQTFRRRISQAEMPLGHCSNACHVRRVPHIILLHQVRRQRIDLVPLPRECSNNTLRGRFWRDLPSCNRNVRRTRNASRQRQKTFRNIIRHQPNPSHPSDLVLQLGEFNLSPLLLRREIDRKSTRLNSSHVKISYAVFCLKKKIHSQP